VTESKNPLTRVRKICLAFPDAYEKVAWNAPTFRVKGGKMFAMFVANHHGDGRVSLWSMASPGVQEEFVAADPLRYFRPPYVGAGGWIGIRLDERPDWKVVSGLLREGYLECAPKKLRKKLEGG
jgi:hypothetical protein